MKYKNTSNQTQSLIGFGVIDPEGIIETKVVINNPNFKLVENEPKKIGIKENANTNHIRKTI